MASGPATAERKSGLARRSDKIAELVAREIVRDIAGRQLEPGTVLPSETIMQATYSVGRASLREALRILEVQGLIQIKPGPGGGPVVSEVSSQEFGRMATLYFHMSGATFRELVEARLIMEPVMAGLAARRQDAEGLKRLKASVHASEDMAIVDDPEYLKMSTEFHGIVAGISGNKILDIFGRSIKDVFTERVSGMIFPVSARDRVRTDHEAIAQAILRGQPARAERLMRAHMEEFAEFITQRYPGLLDEVVDWR
jgi:DNA-binding FadR family transcriptional regulator